ncbi:MAG: hypothetical protein ACI9BD_000753 [Candidatus Marinamargulisbacteria bacterium]|jgi:hypothetical protein
MNIFQSPNMSQSNPGLNKGLNGFDMRKSGGSETFRRPEQRSPETIKKEIKDLLVKPLDIPDFKRRIERHVSLLKELQEVPRGQEVMDRLFSENYSKVPYLARQINAKLGGEMNALEESIVFQKQSEIKVLQKFVEKNKKSDFSKSFLKKDSGVDSASLREHNSVLKKGGELSRCYKDAGVEIEMPLKPESKPEVENSIEDFQSGGSNYFKSFHQPTIFEPGKSSRFSERDSLSQPVKTDPLNNQFSPKRRLMTSDFTSQSKRPVNQVSFLPKPENSITVGQDQRSLFLAGSGVINSGESHSPSKQVGDLGRSALKSKSAFGGLFKDSVEYLPLKGGATHFPKSEIKKPKGKTAIIFGKVKEGLGLCEKQEPNFPAKNDAVKGTTSSRKWRPIFEDHQMSKSQSYVKQKQPIFGLYSSQSPKQQMEFSIHKDESEYLNFFDFSDQAEGSIFC